MFRLLSWLQGRADPVEPELIALAAEVAAVVSSAREVLAKVPDGSERQGLLRECELLSQAADEIVDPRSRLHDLPESALIDALDDFIVHQEHAARLRAAAQRIAGKRDRPLRAIRTARS